MSKSLSVCVPAVDTIEWMDRTVQSLIEQTCKSFDVIVCARANSLSDDLKLLLDSHFSVKIVELHEDARDSDILNCCLSLAEGEYVKFVPAGVCLDSNCLEQFLAALEPYEVLAAVTAPARGISRDGDVIAGSIGPDFVGFRTGESLVQKAFDKFVSPLGDITNVMFRRVFARDGFKNGFDNLSSFELFLHLMSQGDCVALSRPLMNVPHIQVQSKRNLRKESLAEFYEYQLLQVEHRSRYMRAGLSESDAYHEACDFMEKVFCNLCDERNLNEETVAHAARLLAGTLSHSELVELVTNYSATLFSRFERIVSLRRRFEPGALGTTLNANSTGETAEQQLIKYRNALNKELYSLVFSPSWLLTQPLRDAKQIVRSAMGKLKSKQTDSRPDRNSHSADFSPYSVLRNEIFWLEDEIQAIRKSPSWRVSQPFRALYRWKDVQTKCPAFIDKMKQSDKANNSLVDASLVVFDESFPHKLSAFRFCEFTELLKNFPECHVITSDNSTQFVNNSHDKDHLLGTYRQEFPDLANRVHKFSDVAVLRASLAYCVFLSLAHKYLSMFESLNIPFIFTLYPGGLFELNQPKSDAMLRRVMSSPLFRRVIVTQPIVKDYLLANDFCKAESIDEVFGCVTLDSGSEKCQQKRYFGKEKDTKDICFVSHKYHARGHDKGYDVFIQVAKELAIRQPNVFFHVVGGFTATDIDICGIEDRIRFYRALEADELTNFYLSMDAIVSPNIHGVHSPGQFDGFPTGCCIEAGLLAVVPFCTDLLKQNRILVDGSDFVLIDREPVNIADQIEKRLSDMDKFYQMSKTVKQTFSRVFGYSAQIEPRVKILATELQAVSSFQADYSLSVN